METQQTKFWTEVEKFKKNVIDMNVEIFNKCAVITPTVNFLIDKDDPKMIDVELPNEIVNDKTEMRRALEEMIKQIKPFAMSMLLSGWATEGPPSNIPPSKRKDRKQVVIFNFETYNKTCSVIFEVDLSGIEPALINKKDTGWILNNDDNSTGRFAGLLRDEGNAYSENMHQKIDLNKN